MLNYRKTEIYSFQRTYYLFSTLWYEVGGFFNHSLATLKCNIGHFNKCFGYDHNIERLLKHLSVFSSTDEEKAICTTFSDQCFSADEFSWVKN